MGVGATVETGVVCRRDVVNAGSKIYKRLEKRHDEPGCAMEVDHGDRKVVMNFPVDVSKLRPGFTTNVHVSGEQLLQAARVHNPDILNFRTVKVSTKPHDGVYGVTLVHSASEATGANMEKTLKTDPIRTVEHATVVPTGTTTVYSTHHISSPGVESASQLTLIPGKEHNESHLKNINKRSTARWTGFSMENHRKDGLDSRRSRTDDKDRTVFVGQYHPETKLESAMYSFLERARDRSDIYEGRYSKAKLPEKPIHNNTPVYPMKYSDYVHLHTRISNILSTKSKYATGAGIVVTRMDRNESANMSKPLHVQVEFERVPMHRSEGFSQYKLPCDTVTNDDMTRVVNPHARVVPTTSTSAAVVPTEDSDKYVMEKLTETDSSAVASAVDDDAMDPTDTLSMRSVDAAIPVIDA
jgi:hypothetical protein